MSQSELMLYCHKCHKESVVKSVDGVHNLITVDAEGWECPVCDNVDEYRTSLRVKVTFDPSPVYRKTSFSPVVLNFSVVEGETKKKDLWIERGLRVNEKT